MKINASSVFIKKLNSYQFVNTNSFTTCNLNSLPNDVVSFRKTNVLEENKKLFDNYNPQIKDFTAYKIPVHNEKILNYLKQSYIDLMYSPTDNKEILLLRKRLFEAKHGDIFKNEKAIREMLAVGEYRIKTSSQQEFPFERELDGAMSFIFKQKNLIVMLIRMQNKFLKD